MPCKQETKNVGVVILISKWTLEKEILLVIKNTFHSNREIKLPRASIDSKCICS